MSGWTPGSGCQHDLALAVRLHRVGEDDHRLGVWREPLGRVVEVLVGITRRPIATGRVCSRSRRSRAGRRGCDGRRVRSRTKRTPRRATMTRDCDRLSPTRRGRRSASCFSAFQPSGMFCHWPDLRARPVRSVESVGTERDPKLGHRHANPRGGKTKATCRWSLRCLPTSGASSHTRLRGLEPATRADAREHQDVRGADGTGARTTSFSALIVWSLRPRGTRCRGLSAGRNRPGALGAPARR